MKKLKLFVTLMLAMFVSTVSVHAAGITGGGASDWHGRDWDADVTDGADGVVTIKLIANSNAGLQVKAGEKVVLDLNGKTLTNWCDGQADHCGLNNYEVAIDIAEDAELTIIDTSSNHDGKVTLANGTHMMSTIVNNGKLTIEAGEYLINAEADNGLSTIYNYGEMIVNGGTFKSLKEGAAAIHNDGTLTINDGDFSTGIAKSWAVSNNGSATVNGGTFTQNYDYSVLVNTKEMTITDGEFKTAGDDEHNSLITNQKQGDNNAELTIKGGDFDAELLFYNQGEDELNVLGGNYSEDSNITTYIDNNHEVDENGNVVLKDADYSELEKALKDAKAVDKTKYTEETVKALETAIKNAEAVQKDLKADEQDKIDQAVKELNDAIKGLKEVSVTTQTAKPDEENPKTGDNILMYLSLGLASVAVVAISAKKLRKTN